MPLMLEDFEIKDATVVYDGPWKSFSSLDTPTKHRYKGPEEEKAYVPTKQSA